MAALRLYMRQGYAVHARTDCGACACLQARLLDSFLGHPVWVHMAKPVPIPASLLPACRPPPGMQASRAGQEEGLVVVPLDDSRWQDGGEPPAPLRDSALRMREPELALVPLAKHVRVVGAGLTADGRVGAHPAGALPGSVPAAAPLKAVWRGSSEDPATPLVLYAVNEPRERSISHEDPTARSHSALVAGPAPAPGTGLATAAVMTSSGPATVAGNASPAATENPILARTEVAALLTNAGIPAPLARTEVAAPPSGALHGGR